jgi:hypothetical protein
LAADWKIMLEEITKIADGERRPLSDTFRMPGTFYDLLEAISKRPATYLGRKSLVAFSSWLQGYSFAKLESHATRSGDEEEFGLFDAFICEKYDWRDAGGWSAKIAYYHRDDAAAFDEFFKLLAEFRASREQSSEKSL